MGTQPRLFRISPLLFISGFCALIYQTTWLREFRLIFGASTAATAAVLGIFMAGLGFGSLILGRRVETSSQPLRFYAKLELLIAASAGATPILLLIIRHAYLAMGGTLAMGPTIGTAVRLISSTSAIGLPTFLMGGTLPAIARLVTRSADSNRRALALLYGINTLGAVTGAAASTFYFFEQWGNHLTLAFGVVCNVVVGLIAFWMSKRESEGGDDLVNAGTELDQEAPGPAGFVYIAAAVVGFVFLLMELVWYRMLSPLLGGSTFTFGLILAVALLGIGLGSILYSFVFHNRQITLNGFGFVCALEAAFIAFPYALGDHIALATMLLRPLGSLGFYGHVIAWTTVCVIVVLPAAIVSGVQFPLLVALLGKGRARVAAHTGMAYACNTGGAIVGSLAGGFGLIPALSAPGAWKLVVILLCGIAASAAATNLTRRPRNYFRLIPSLGVTALALCFLSATGPTAFWRHSQIGVGRVTRFLGTKNDYHDLENTIRRDILWEADGVESSVALSNSHGINFVVNGRCDGNSIGDSGTQIMSGLIAAALNEHPKRALVVGLGTGSTAGWLAAVPSMEHVDVVELEPTVVQVARACAAVNQNALSNPKLRVIIGDGREVMLSTQWKYDVIASEPSNPYRAGVASLFTREYYQAAASRLNSGGLFAQWIQAYQVDAPTLETVYATLGSVFSQVETWQTQSGDLLVIASLIPQTYDAEVLRQRLGDEPFKSALVHTWGVTTLEGFLAHFVGNNSFARTMQRAFEVPINTDDKTLLEFAFARSVGRNTGFTVETLRDGARLTHSDRPDFSKGEESVDWKQMESDRLSMLLGFGQAPNVNNYADSEQRERAAAYASYLKGDLDGTLSHLHEPKRELSNLYDLRLFGESLAETGQADAMKYVDKLRKFAPVDADAIYAHLLFRRGEFDRATDVLEKVFVRLRADPWLDRSLVQHTLTVAQMTAHLARSSVPAQRLFDALSEPFSSYNEDEPRKIALLQIAMILDKDGVSVHTATAAELAEPFVPWQEGFLKTRRDCYKATGNPLLARAERDLQKFNAAEPAGFNDFRFAKPGPIRARESNITVSSVR
ncbi:MAG TPA: fused MFS/spermidine synthase [Chthoniobacterales bacterium]|nr:fused MFS/spermidine synthase [Chthoniobacterales bacterium]